jgi:hypothetical protein
MLIFYDCNNNQNNTQKTISKSVKWLFVNLFQNLGSGYMKLLHRILAAILKMADISKFLKRRIAPLMVTYHYVKCYVSIIIHLEVININVRNPLLDTRH